MNKHPPERSRFGTGGLIMRPDDKSSEAIFRVGGEKGSVMPAVAGEGRCVE